MPQASFTFWIDESIWMRHPPRMPTCILCYDLGSRMTPTDKFLHQALIFRSSTIRLSPFPYDQHLVIRSLLGRRINVRRTPRLLLQVRYLSTCSRLFGFNGSFHLKTLSETSSLLELVNQERRTAKLMRHGQRQPRQA